MRGGELKTGGGEGDVYVREGKERRLQLRVIGYRQGMIREDRKIKGEVTCEEIKGAGRIGTGSGR